MARMCRSATSRTSASPNRCRRTVVSVPSSIILTIWTEERSSETRVGPRMNVGLTTVSSVPPPSLPMKSQAARSATALERG